MKLTFLASLACLLLNAAAFAQKTTKAEFFSPNPAFKVESDKIKPFLDETPEISKKADYYLLSVQVLKTLLVVQSNAGTVVSDGQFNFARVISSKHNQEFPAFAKAKDGFVVCDYRRKGVELAAFTMSQIRGGKKKALSDEKWMQLLFGPGSDLESLKEPAQLIYQEIKSGPKTKPGGAVVAEKPKAELPPTEKVPQPKTEPVAKPEAPKKDPTPVVVEKKEMPAAEPVPQPEAPKEEVKPVVVEKTEPPKEEKPAEVVPVLEKVVEKKTELQPEIPQKEPTAQVDKAKSQPATAPVVGTDQPKIMEDATPVIKPFKNRHNIVKTNILYPVAIGFEHIIGKHISLMVSGFYLPKLAIGNAEGSGYGRKSLENASIGFAGEARYYTSKKKANMTGFYFGGFYTQRKADVAAQKVFVDGQTTIDAKVTVPTGLIMYGGMIGKQIIGKKGFTSDLTLGVGPYVVYSIPDIGSNAEEPYKTLSSYTKYKSGIGPRLCISMGYAF